MLVVTSDRGLAGAYSANALRTAEALYQTLREEGKESSIYAVGRKAAAYYRFRDRTVERDFTGFSEQPDYDSAKAAADALIEQFVKPTEEGGVDDIHIVFTEFRSCSPSGRWRGGSCRWSSRRPTRLRQRARFRLYEFEPSAEDVLDALLPRYVESRVFAALLESAASESAARRRAMKSATDNAEELIKSLTRAANSARQAEITQEISEIVGGANALAEVGA